MSGGFTFAGGTAEITGATDHPLLKAMLAAPQIILQQANEVATQHVQNYAEPGTALGRQ